MFSSGGDKQKHSIFYSRNPANLQKDLALCNITSIDTFILDYSLKKTINFVDLCEGLNEISKFTNFRSIYINMIHCNVTKDNIKSLFEKLSSTFSKKLKQASFVLDNNDQIEQAGIERLMRLLVQCTGLTSLTLSLRKCNLNKDCFAAILKSVKQMDLKLFSINLETNQIVYDSTLQSHLQEMFDKSANSLNTLEICLSHNQLKDDGLSDISHSIQKVANLNSLLINLLDNKVNNKGLKDLSTSLQQLHDLKVLHINLDWNAIAAEGAKELSTIVSSLNNLVSLNIELDYNKIGASGAKDLTVGLKGLNNLNNLLLNFAHNDFGDEGLNNITSNLPQLPNLKSIQLEVGWNKVNEESAKQFVTQLASFCSNANSFTLTLDNNKIGDQAGNALSETLFQLKKVQIIHLDLEETKLKTLAVKNLMTCLKSFPNLKGLFINFCKNDVTNDTINLLELEIKKVLPQLAKEGQTFKFGDQPFLTKKNFSQGLSYATTKFCEKTRDNIPVDQSSLLLNRLEFKNTIQDYTRPENVNAVFFETHSTNFNVLSDNVMDASFAKDLSMLEDSQGNINLNDSHSSVPLEDLRVENNKLKAINTELQFRIQKLEPEPFTRTPTGMNGSDSTVFCRLLPFTLDGIVMDKKIGTGTFGNVMQVMKDNQRFALKMVEIDFRESKNVFSDMRYMWDQINLVTSTIRYEKLLYVYGLACDMTQQGVFKINVLSELMKSNLLQFIKEKHNSDNQKNLHISRQILESIVFFQKNRISHCGLKPSNILLDDHCNIQISDLGIAQIAQIMTNSGESTSVHGFAPQYCAPEIFDGQSSEVTDIWSFGCILFHLFTGEVPWSGLSEYQQLRSMYQKVTILAHFRSLPNSSSIKLDPTIEKIIDRCTSYDQRPLAEELLAALPKA